MCVCVCKLANLMKIFAMLCKGLHVALEQVNQDKNRCVIPFALAYFVLQSVLMRF